MTATDWALIVGSTLAGLALLVFLLRRNWQSTIPEPQQPPTIEQPAAATALQLAGDAALPDDDARHIAAVTARAVDHLASVLVARRLGMTAGEQHALVEAMYADLRRSMTAPQLARALLIALRPDARERARVLVDQFRDLPTNQES